MEYHQIVINNAQLQAAVSRMRQRFAVGIKKMADEAMRTVVVPFLKDRNWKLQVDELGWSMYENGKFVSDAYQRQVDMAFDEISQILDTKVPGPKGRLFEYMVVPEEVLHRRQP